MELTTVFWATDPCPDCGGDQREVTCVETVDGEEITTILLECTSADCVALEPVHLLAA